MGKYKKNVQIISEPWQNNYLSHLNEINKMTDPEHFLIGKTNNYITEPSLIHERDNLLNR